MILSAGITESARNDIVRNGVAPLQPSAAAASVHARLCAITSSSGATEKRPATGSGHSASTRPSSTATIPPPSSTARATAASMSSSETPSTTRLCASCATVDASAPRCRPGAAHEADTDAAGCKVPLDHGDLREVALGIGDREAVHDRGALDERLRHDLVGDEPDHADRASVARRREIARA